MLPPGHFLVSTGLKKLGEVRGEAKQLDDAERLFLEVLAIRQAAGLGDHPDSALQLWRLALVQAATTREEAACGWAVACLAIRTARLIRTRWRHARCLPTPRSHRRMGGRPCP